MNRAIQTVRSIDVKTPDSSFHRRELERLLPSISVMVSTKGRFSHPAPTAFLGGGLGEG